MSKISCDVIKDLMVLYDDNVCSEESRRLVEEHIRECGECRRLYETAAAGLPDISLEKDGKADDAENGDEMSETFRRACKKLERKITYRHILTVWITIWVIVILATIWTEWLNYQINVVPSEDIQVTELYELADGSVYCTFKCKDVITAVNTSAIKVPEGMRYKECDDGWQEVYFQYPGIFFGNPVDKMVYGDEVSIIFPKVDNGYGGTHKCKTIYYGRKNKDDKLIVWEEGQVLEPAPEEIEKKVDKQKSEYFSDFAYMEVIW